MSESYLEQGKDISDISIPSVDIQMLSVMKK